MSKKADKWLRDGGWRVISALSLSMAAIVGVLGAPLVAGAAVSDPTGGGATTLSTDITGWITSYGVPFLVSIMAVSLIVLLFIKYGKKGVKSAT